MQHDYIKPHFFWLPSEMANFAMLEREENEKQNALKRKRASSLTLSSFQTRFKAARTSLGFQRIKPAVKSWASKSCEHWRQRWSGSGREWWEAREREEDGLARAEFEEWLGRRRLVLGREELGTGGEGPSRIWERWEEIREEKDRAEEGKMMRKEEKDGEMTPKIERIEKKMAFGKEEQRSVDLELEVEIEIDPECCENCRLKVRKRVREGKRKAE